MRTAQTEALRRNRQIVLSFTNAVPALNAPAVAGGRNWSLQTVAQFGETAEFVAGGNLADVASGVTITATPPTAAICFNSNGRMVSNTATTGVPGASCNAAATALDVANLNADRNLRVTLALGGQVRMCDPKRTLSANAPDGC